MYTYWGFSWSFSSTVSRCFVCLYVLLTKRSSRNPHNEATKFRSCGIDLIYCQGRYRLSTVCQEGTREGESWAMGLIITGSQWVLQFDSLQKIQTIKVKKLCVRFYLRGWGRCCVVDICLMAAPAAGENFEHEKWGADARYSLTFSIFDFLSDLS